jgi:hypothetical protein
MKRILIALALSASLPVYAQTYMDDTNVVTGEPSRAVGGWPKIMLSETQSDDANGQQLSKYDVLGLKNGMMYRVSQAQKINPNVEFHYSFHPAEYLGYVGGTNSDCNKVGHGPTFAETAVTTDYGTPTEDDVCQVYAGHWLYSGGSSLVAAINDTDLSIEVDDASTFYDGEYIAIYNDNINFVDVEHIEVDTVNKTTNVITLKTRGYKSTALSHAADSRVVSHIQGSGGGTEDFAYNQSAFSPPDANSRYLRDIMIEWIPQYWKLKSDRTEPDPTDPVVVTGVYFDADPYWKDDAQARTQGGSNRMDVNNDGVVDQGNSPYSDWYVWGAGMDLFYFELRSSLTLIDPDIRIVGGYRSTRGYPSLNGTQMENWLLTSGEFSPDYEYFLDTTNTNQKANSWQTDFVAARTHRRWSDQAVSYNEMLTKAPSLQYKNTVQGVTSPVPTSNSNHRFGLAMALMLDGYYGRQNSSYHPDPWYDEYAVDTFYCSDTWGQAIATNSADETAVRENKGWLGEPTSEYVRVYDPADFAATENLIPTNFSFESGVSGWNEINTVLSSDTTEASEGSKSMKASMHTVYNASLNGTRFTGPSFAVTAGKEYTITFSAKSSKMREIALYLGWSTNYENLMIPTEWTRYVLTYKAKVYQNIFPIFQVGRENSTIWIDEVRVFEGNPNVFQRDYEYGVVVANATPAAKTVTFATPLLRIDGTQDAVNSGAEVSSVTIPPWDAAILVRREADIRPAEVNCDGSCHP